MTHLRGGVQQRREDQVCALWCVVHVYICVLFVHVDAHMRMYVCVCVCLCILCLCCASICCNLPVYILCSGGSERKGSGKVQFCDGECLRLCVCLMRVGILVGVLGLPNCRHIYCIHMAATVLK